MLPSLLFLVGLAACFPTPDTTPDATRLSDGTLPCNGHVELCSQRYGNLTFVAAHNCPFVGILPVNNQYLAPRALLNLGVRALQIQMHPADDAPAPTQPSDIRLCHTKCGLRDAGDLGGLLDILKTWMGLEGNEREIITLILTNEDGIGVDVIAETFKERELDKLVVAEDEIKGDQDKWPTLGDMLDRGKRLVVFMDYYADTTKVNWIFPEFNYQWQNRFDETDSSFPSCAVDRPSGLTNPSSWMYMINHYLDIPLPFGVLIPDRGAAGKTNSRDDIVKQVDMCRGMWGRNPNVILMDWINVGDAIAVQDELNGVQ